MNILVKSKLVTLGPGDLLGSGGEANVFAKNGKAYKIFHKANKERGKKLEVLLGKNLPAKVLAPEELAFSKAGAIVGYEMSLADPSAEPLKMLSNRNYRRQNRIGIPETAAIFSDFHATLAALHASGIVVGDLNDLNELFLGKNVYFIDSDSFQIDGYPCIVATEDFLCPDLYDKSLTSGRVFSPATDWYSYSVLLYRSLLLVHPYGGVFPGITKVTERAKRRLTALDSKVKYPKLGTRPEVLSDDLLAHFHEVFEQGRYREFPLPALLDFAGSLKRCPVCDEPFWSGRRNCPACSHVVVIPIAKLTGRYRTQAALQTTGTFLFSCLVSGKLYAITSEKGKLFLESWNGSATKTELFGEAKGLTFGIAARKLVVGRKGTGKVVIVEPTNGKPITTTETELFENRPVFGGTNRFFYRITSGFLLQGELRGAELVEQPIASVLSGQTWFAVDDETGEERIFLAGRLFEGWNFRLIVGKNTNEVDASKLATGEKLIRVFVRFGGKEILLGRETKEQGKSYLRLDLIGENGMLIAAHRLNWEEEFEGCFLGAYQKGVFIYPSGEGLKAIRPKTGERSMFEETDQFVTGTEKLYHWRGKIIAIGEKNAFAIEKGG